MARDQDLSDLTDLQLALLSALWKKGEATIAEVHALLPEKLRVSVKTVATLLGRLERRGLVSHRMEGREGVYRARASKQKVLMARIGGVLSAFFDSDDAELGAAALSKRDVKRGDAARLLELLKRAERDVRRGK